MKLPFRSKLPQQYYPNISARITLPFLLTVVVIAGIGAFIVTRLVAGNIQERLDAQLIDSTSAANTTIVEIERKTLATLRLMTFTSGIGTATEARDTAGIDRLLGSIAGNEGIDDLIVFDRSGDPIYRYKRETFGGGGNTLPDTRNWPSVQRVLSGEVDSLGDKFVDMQQVGSEFTFFTAGAIANEDGETVGGLLIGLTSRRLVLLLKEQAVASITLLDTDGNVLDTSFRTGVTDQFKLTPEQLVELQETEASNISYTPRYTIDDVIYQFILAPLQFRSTQLGWVGLGLRVDFITERIGSSRDVFFLFFMVMLVIVIIVGATVSRSIIRPIFRLLDTTRAIRSGDLSRRANLAMPDELGELSQSFDHMTSELLKRNSEINNLYAAALKETVQREAVLTSISDAVIVVDMNNRPILVNTAARTLQKSVGSRSDFQALFGDPSYYSQARSITVSSRHFSALSTPVRLPQGDLLGYVMVFRDVTSLVEAEQVKDEVILQLSHELRTPLTAAKGYVELVKMMAASSLPDMYVDFLDKAHGQIKTLSGMIDQVVEVNAIMANRFSIEVKPIDLTQLLEEIAESLRERIQANEHTYIVTVPDFPVMIDGDVSRLTQVFVNIIINAFSYTLPGGWIEVYLETDESSCAIIRVHDSGVGIGEDEIEKVFEKLYRGRSADAGPTDTRGMGLGLYISKQIVEAHNGTIKLDSEINVGTTVTIMLPLAEKMVMPYGGSGTIRNESI